jgi:hypothetical protein
VGSNPAVYWMVVGNTSYYKPNEIKRIKVAQWGSPKKKIIILVYI